MKKYIILLIFSTLTIFCSKDNSISETPSEAPTEIPENPENPENPKVYSYNYSSKKIVELNLNDGSEIGIIAELGFSNVDFTNLVYSINTNEIIGTIIVPTVPPKPSEFDFYFVRVNVLNGQVYLNPINFQNYLGFTMSNDGKLYTYRKSANDRKIVELDPNDGTEIRIIADLQALNENNFIPNLVYSETTNELVGIQDLLNPPTYNYWLTRVNIENGIFTRSALEYTYNVILMSDNGKLYAYNSKIVELDPFNGSEIRIITVLENKILSYINYSETTNELISFIHTPGVAMNLAKINLDNGQLTEIDFDGWHYGFILVDQ